MATIETKHLIDQLIANNGHFDTEDDDLGPPDPDPPVLSITEYQTPEGQTVWGVCYPQDPINRYAASVFVRNPRVIFRHEPHADCNHPAGK